MKVTATTCLDGKRHRWKALLATTSSADDPVVFDQRWCRQCGCSTQFLYNLNRKGARRTWKRCKNSDGSYDIEIPDCHKTPRDKRDERLARQREERQESRINEESPT